MKKLKKGTILIIFDNKGEDKINFGYSLGILKSIYSTDERVFCNVISYDEEDIMEYNSLEYGKEVMTLEDYKDYLISRLSYNNAHISLLTEDNNYIFERIKRLDSDSQEVNSKLSLRKK